MGKGRKMGSKGKIPAFALVAFIALVAPVGAVDFGVIDSPFLKSWEAMAIAGLSVAASVVAIAYMYSEFFNLPGAKQRAKEEAYQLGVSILLVVFILLSMHGLGIFFSDVASSKFGSSGAAFDSFCEENRGIYGPDPSHPENVMFAYADWFLGCSPSIDDDIPKIIEEKYNPSIHRTFYDAIPNRGILLTDLMNQYIGLMTVEMLLGPLSTFGASAYVPEAIMTAISVNVAPNAGLTPISDATIMMVDLLGVGLGAVIMQKVLLVFTYQNALTVLLPLGIVMRAFPFLRKTGSTLIALALVLYFVFPITIWLNEQIYFGIQGKLISWANYTTLAQVCQERSQGETTDEFKERISRSIQAYYMEGYGVEESINDMGGGNKVLPFSQEKSAWESFKSSAGKIGAYLLGGKTGEDSHFWPSWILGPVLPTNFFFEAMVDQLTVSMQYLVLNLLFIVNSILISITLFRDISLAIGGEPSVFGISKLM